MNSSMGNLQTQMNPPDLRTPRKGSSILTYWLVTIIVIVIAVPVYAIGFSPKLELISQTNLPEYQEMGFIPKEIITAEEKEEREEIEKETANLKIDQTINLSMYEWGFDKSNLNVKNGEVVKFIVTNDGNIPHEWMIMKAETMEEVKTWMENADFLLKEHEALVEAAMMLPGQTFETIFQAEQPGMYMFMCMFPYHMQMGMMGMIMVDSDMNMGNSMNSNAQMNMNGDSQMNMNEMENDGGGMKK
ncbi:plastocyanin/azurin family copper-binding protein [Microaerobacter geothermalis]|uniref:plastocyanin/azurin family copper-binding protein n=1 Tax=Microaerobacter geothermalis TaxID=674972 RepID=UPI001F184490|nr:plastocyanin/azurin family copper-binding protein [Microaerobacter geothermalis]MCF6094383.1 plastocyanin/azurin family copper-binding protein [Microaerobacter geothermalis]